MNLSDPVVVFSASQAVDRRRRIHDELIKDHDVSVLLDGFKVSNLEQMWNLYDNVFFGGEIGEKLTADRSTLTFQVTPGAKSAKTGGWCQTTKSPGRSRCFFTISIPLGLYKNLFVNGEGSYDVNGIKCRDRLECLQLVLEHEAMHMMMGLYGHDGRQPAAIFSAHGKLFQSMVFAYFGHTETKHSMGLGDADQMLTRADVPPGTSVKFEHKGVMHYGIVKRHNPKTISVDTTYPSAIPGWKVPINMLKSAEFDDIPVSSVKTLSRADIPIGTHVKFAHKGVTHRGTVKNHNPTTISVEVGEDVWKTLISNLELDTARTDH